jgi:hypothetical protein
MSAPAWQGNWRERIKERVHEHGFETVTEFADSQPVASLVTLARQLGRNRDVAAAQLEQMLLHEAEERSTVERCARGLLVRQLHEKFPEGWPGTWDDAIIFRRARAYSAWAGALSERYKHCYRRVGEALRAASRDTSIIPPCWLPAGPDDPILFEIFAMHWQDSESGEMNTAE